jgi:serine/threonine protein kinase
MDISSHGYSISEPAWSLVASILPSVFNPAGLPDTPIDPGTIARVFESWSLKLILGINLETSIPPSFIAKGATYEVYAQKFDEWDRIVAVKHVRSSFSGDELEEAPVVDIEQHAVLREVCILRMFHDNPNFLSILGWGTRAVGPKENLFLVVDYAPLGSLDRFLKDHSSTLAAEHLIAICGDIAEALQALHSERMAHGDVKTANVLVFHTGPGMQHKQYVAKISDLGFAISLDLDEPVTCYRGTDIYNAPEIRGNASRNLGDIDCLACDVYSYGLLVWMVFKLGGYFLDDVPDVAMGQNSEAEIRDSVEASQLLAFAKEFGKSRATEVETALLEKVFSGALQPDPALRVSMKGLCSLYSSIYHQ